MGLRESLELLGRVISAWDANKRTRQGASVDWSKLPPIPPEVTRERDRRLGERDED